MNLTIWDFFLAPIYFIVLSTIAKRMRDKRYPASHPLHKYYMWGLYAKFFGAIFIALVYEYYYGGGDTFSYFYCSKIVNSAFGDSITTWFKLILARPVDQNPELYPYVSQLFWYGGPSHVVFRFAAIFGILNGTSYIPIALLFAFFSYTGIWAMYRTFVNLYPKLYKELAVAFLFIPSCFVWGSAVFKDTICMFGLGWMTYTTFRVFINRDFSIKNIFLLAFSFYLVATTKVYILLAFAPAMLLWVLTTYSTHIKSGAIRFFVMLFFFAICIGAFLFFSNKFAQELNTYSLENIAHTAESTRNWISYTSGAEGSSYDLGEFDPSIGGMLKKFPQAVAVTLFRPFPWEARKVIMMLSCMEAMVFLYFTFKAFKANGVRKSFQLIGKDPNLLFCLVFSIIFAFAVGISSYNFGSLSRYKIPCLPFYATFIIILLYKNKHSSTITIKKHSKKSIPSFK